MSKLAVAATVAVLILSQTSPAYAYLDPGTGSILLQAVVAGLAVFFAAITAFWTRIRRLFERRSRSVEPEREGEGPDQQPS